MAVIRYQPTNVSPFALLERMAREFDSIWGRQEEGGDAPIFEWSPAVDVLEDENGWTLHADAPGVDRDSLKVTLEEGVLTVSGEKKATTHDTEKDGRRLAERVYGRFQRALRLPGSADGSKVSANYTDGVLEVRIPRQEAAKPKTIDIKVK